MASTPHLPALTLARSSNVSANWQDFAAGLVETIGNFALKGWADGGVSGLVSLSKLLGTASIEEPTEGRAWRLIALCFAWALDDLKGQEPINVDALRSSLRQALDLAKTLIDQGEAQVTSQFLKTPSTLPLYINMRNVVIQRRVELGLPGTYSDDLLISKLDTAFTFGVFEVWSRDPSFYKVISDYFESPFSEAVERELNWKSYRLSLVHGFEVMATFGQEDAGISLAQLYVPLRAYWEDMNERRERNGDGRLPKDAQGVFLDDALDEWATGPASQDWLRLVGGGPGSGKSTTLRAFASRLAINDAVRPLFIPLQHIGVDGDLRAAINRHFTGRSGSAFTSEPLSRASIEGGSPLVLIFDGLDELVAPTETAKEVISQFVHKMNALVNELRGNNAISLKVVVSGRMLAFQSARKLMTLPPHGSLEVYGYLPASTRNLSVPNPIWDIDQRKEWWGRYSTAVGASSAVPEAFNAPELSSITHEPLLSYLLVLAGFSSHNWERAAENPNRIYATLMNDIYSRGWGGSSVTTRSMTLPEFNLLMQTIGLAAWLGGDSRVASETGFLSTLVITRAEDAWSNFNADKGPDVTNLAMNFYLKADDKSGRGFEFTHKSFGEYLAALAIVEVSLTILKMTGLRLEFSLQEWFRATCTGNLTSEVQNFLRQEVRLRIQEKTITLEQAYGLKAIFENIANAAALYGFPTFGSDNWRISEKKQLCAEHAAWGVLNAIVLGIMSCDDGSDINILVPSIEGIGLRDLLSRHGSQYDPLSSIGSCLTALKAVELYVLGYYGGDLDLSYSKIGRLIFEGGRIYGGKLSHSEVENWSVHGCVVSNFEIDNVEIINLSLSDTRFIDVDFSSLKSTRVLVDEETIIPSFPFIPKDNIELYGREDDTVNPVDSAKDACEFIRGWYDQAHETAGIS